MIVQSTVDLRFDRASPEADGGHGWTIVSIRCSGTAPAGRFRLTGACQTVGASSTSESAGDRTAVGMITRGSADGSSGG